MVKPVRAVLVGAKAVGKTAIASQFACGTDLTDQPYVPSPGDSYVISVEHDKLRDCFILIDTAGLDSPSTPVRPLLNCADFVFFVCSADNPCSLDYLEPVAQCVDQMQKEKKDVTLSILINHSDSKSHGNEQQVATVYAKCSKEKLRCFKVNPKSPRSVAEPFKFVLNKYFSSRDSRFLLPKKSKERGPGAAILLDF